MNILKRILRRFSRTFTRVKPEKIPDSASVNAGILKQIEHFQKKIGYVFNNKNLLIQSLTHKSGIHQSDKKGLSSNERLEFLGDAILNLLVTEHLYMRYPEYAEGQLSKIKSLLVSRKIIGDIARGLDAGKVIIMGQSEKKSGGAMRMSITSNAFEAIIGATYLDSGLDQTRQLLERLLFPEIDSIVNDECNINYKSKILELAQRDGFGIPRYPLIAEKGPDHNKYFTVGIEIAGVRLGEGTGSNKKNAQQNAALTALKTYNKEYIQSQRKGE